MKRFCTNFCFHFQLHTNSHTVHLHKHTKLWNWMWNFNEPSRTTKSSKGLRISGFPDPLKALLQLWDLLRLLWDLLCHQIWDPRAAKFESDIWNKKLDPLPLGKTLFVAGSQPAHCLHVAKFHNLNYLHCLCFKPWIDKALCQGCGSGSRYLGQIRIRVFLEVFIRILSKQPKKSFPIVKPTCFGFFFSKHEIYIFWWLDKFWPNPVFSRICDTLQMRPWRDDYGARKDLKSGQSPNSEVSVCTRKCNVRGMGIAKKVNARIRITLNKKDTKILTYFHAYSN